MVPLKIAGFIVGLNGLATVFDKTCAIWRIIAQAGGYGEDIAKTMNKIEMEYFRFQAWWTAIESLATDPRTRLPSPPIPSTLPQTTLISNIHAHLENPLINAASNFLRLLNELQEILGHNGVLTLATASGQPHTGDAAQSNIDLAVDVSRFRARQKALGKDLLQSVSWWKRTKYGAAAWRDTDKDRMIGIHEDLVYWRESLYGILPEKLRESVLEQGIAAYLLDSRNQALDLSQIAQSRTNQTSAVIEYAHLFDLRERTRSQAGQSSTPALQDIVNDMKLTSAEILGTPNIFDAKHPFSILTFTDHHNSSESKVLIEWYPFPPPQSTLDVHNLGRERIARLAYLLQQPNRPKTLHTLNARGYLENMSAECFGLVLNFPDWALSTAEPTTLHQLFSRQRLGPPSQPLPSLEKKYELAAILASNLYTFMLTRWHHKRFHSSSIFFLCPRTPAPANAYPDLTQPLVGGYVVSRPDDPTQETYMGMPAAETDMYFHPDLRVVPPQQVPRFQKSFEIYSFGILLAEIGFWNVLPTIAFKKGQSRQISPATLRRQLIDKCTSDLACWMGERYRDVTLRCLRAEMTQDGGVGDDLNDFYWHVVVELIKCAPAA